MAGVRNNPCVEAIVKTLLDAGIRPEAPEVTKGCHVRVRWQANGNKRQYHTGASPSDWRAPRKAASDVRRMLREDGLAL